MDSSIAELIKNTPEALIALALIHYGYKLASDALSLMEAALIQQSQVIKAIIELDDQN